MALTIIATILLTTLCVSAIWFPIYFKEKNKKQSDNLQKFLAEMTVRRDYWMRKGEYDFAAGYTKMIDAFSLPNQEPVTGYGIDIKKKLENA
mgnify:CR=1 FL=1